SLLVITVFLLRTAPVATLFPYTTLFRSCGHGQGFRPLCDPVRQLRGGKCRAVEDGFPGPEDPDPDQGHRQDRQGQDRRGTGAGRDRKSTRLNSSHVKISYAVFCLKKKIE